MKPHHNPLRVQCCSMPEGHAPAILVERAVLELEGLVLVAAKLVML